MKVLVHDYGGYDFPLQLSRELARRGNRVTHLYVNFLKTPRGEFAGDVLNPNFKVAAVEMHPDYDRKKYSFLNRFAMNLGYAWRLLREVRKYKPDVVLSGNTPTEVQWPLAILCRFSGIRFVNWVQDFFSIAVRKILSKKMGWLGNALGVIYEHGDKMVIGCSSCNILITSDFKKQLDAWGIKEHNVVVIPNWASIENFSELDKCNSWSVPRGLDQKFVFLYSGTLGLKHNPSLFLKLALEFEHDKSVAIVVVTEGAGAEQLRREADKTSLQNLYIFPYQPTDLVPSVLASGNVLMAVLERDAGVFSVPSKVLTYLCAGKPILLSVPLENQAAKMVMEHEMGLASEPENEEIFLANALRLRDSPSLRIQLGKNAKSYAREYFHIKKIADRFEAAMSIYHHKKILS